MAALMASGLRRLLPRTLFGRLTLLLGGFALLSHALALTVMFELRPPPGHAPPPGPPPLLMPLGLLLDMGVRLGALTLAAWIAASWLARPIKRLAEAAHELGRSIGRPAAGSPQRTPLAEQGPQECREAARVFNQMQAQIEHQLQEHDRFVAAVSHDLRTPLTRMRLRAESLPCITQRRQFTRDIAEMDQMIGATLDYLRGAAEAEALVPLDVQALAESLAEDQRACGHDVSCRGSAAPLNAMPSALRRALVNLVDNAVRYGTSARIRLVDSPDALRIEVHDRGPGIPPGELDKVMAPFYRVDASRNREHGGVGLGLSIAHDIARRHGGALLLHNLPEGGLLAALSLPR